MFRLVISVFVAAHLSYAADFLKQLTPKDFKPGSAPPVSLLRLNQPVTCAIPLKQVKVQNPARIDPIEFPSNSRNIDKGIVHRTPIPVCSSGAR